MPPATLTRSSSPRPSGEGPDHRGPSPRQGPAPRRAAPPQLGSAFDTRPRGHSIRPPAACSRAGRPPRYPKTSTSTSCSTRRCLTRERRAPPHREFRRGAAEAPHHTAARHIHTPATAAATPAITTAVHDPAFSGPHRRVSAACVAETSSDHAKRPGSSRAFLFLRFANQNSCRAIYLARAFLNALSCGPFHHGRRGWNYSAQS